MAEYFLYKSCAEERSKVYAWCLGDGVCVDWVLRRIVGVGRLKNRLGLGVVGMLYGCWSYFVGELNGHETRIQHGCVPGVDA
jgi:hypothetical protein